ncbi:hypothetical protein IWX90DRAFT_427779 [Phyllosticta citrichinensis]|uniref:Secreted protein n=1 Tax=Phyllosticta citrichinensis TaxID=1130410 RepID=A0ABR1XZM2_9PEZI
MRHKRFRFLSLFTITTCPWPAVSASKPCDFPWLENPSFIPEHVSLMSRPVLPTSDALKSLATAQDFRLRFECNRNFAMIRLPRKLSVHQDAFPTHYRAFAQGSTLSNHVHYSFKTCGCVRVAISNAEYHTDLTCAHESKFCTVGGESPTLWLVRLRRQDCTRVRCRMDDSGRLVSRSLRMQVRTPGSVGRRPLAVECWQRRCPSWTREGGKDMAGLLLRYFPRLSRSLKTYLAINLSRQTGERRASASLLGRRRHIRCQILEMV